MIEEIDEETIKMFLVKRTQVLFSEKYHIHNLSIDQLMEKIKLNVQEYFINHELKETYDVSRDEIDEAQIIYSYINSQNCHSVMIQDKWLQASNSTKLDKELLKFLHHHL